MILPPTSSPSSLVFPQALHNTYVCSHQLQEEASLMTPTYEDSRIILGITSLTFFFLFLLLSVVFGSALGLWAIQLPVPRYPGSVWCREPGRVKQGRSGSVGRFPELLRRSQNNRRSYTWASRWGLKVLLTLVEGTGKFLNKNRCTVYISAIVPASLWLFFPWYNGV